MLCMSALNPERWRPSHDSLGYGHPRFVRVHTFAGIRAHTRSERARGADSAWKVLGVSSLGQSERRQSSQSRKLAPPLEKQESSEK